MTSVAGLESFLTVARCGNLTEAARELHVTQPGLTARLQRLEAELGTELLVRLPRGVRLTEAGRALLPYAERAVESLEQGTAAVRDLVRGTGGRIEVGAAPAVSTYVLPRALQRFTTEHPAISLGVRTGHSEELLELVLSEQIQIGIVRTLRHPQIESTPLYEDEVVLATHPAHPLAGDHAVRVEQLGDQDLILFDPSSSYQSSRARCSAPPGSPRAGRWCSIRSTPPSAWCCSGSGSPSSRAARSAMSLPTAPWPPSRWSRRPRCGGRSSRSGVVDAGELTPALAGLVRCVRDAAA